MEWSARPEALVTKEWRPMVMQIGVVSDDGTGVHNDSTT